MCQHVFISIRISVLASAQPAHSDSCPSVLQWDLHDAGFSPVHHVSESIWCRTWDLIFFGRLAQSTHLPMLTANCVHAGDPNFKLRKGFDSRLVGEPPMLEPAPVCSLANVPACEHVLACLQLGH